MMLWFFLATNNAAAEVLGDRLAALGAEVSGRVVTVYASLDHRQAVDDANPGHPCSCWYNPTEDHGELLDAWLPPHITRSIP
jgi:hypothetical protein